MCASGWLASESLFKKGIGATDNEPVRLLRHVLSFELSRLASDVMHGQTTAPRDFKYLGTLYYPTIREVGSARFAINTFCFVFTSILGVRGWLGTKTNIFLLSPAAVFVWLRFNQF